MCVEPKAWGGGGWTGGKLQQRSLLANVIRRKAAIFLMLPASIVNPFGTQPSEICFQICSCVTFYHIIENRFLSDLGTQTIVDLFLGTPKSAFGHSCGTREKLLIFRGNRMYIFNNISRNTAPRNGYSWTALSNISHVAWWRVEGSICNTTTHKRSWYVQGYPDNHFEGTEIGLDFGKTVWRSGRRGAYDTVWKKHCGVKNESKKRNNINYFRKYDINR